MKKYLILSIVFLSIGILGLVVTGFIAHYGCGRDIGACFESNFGISQGYSFGMNDMMNMMSSRRFSDKNLSLKSFSFQEIKDSSDAYLSSYGLKNLKITEIMEFSNNFYIEVVEEDTGIGALELLQDKSDGSIFPEYGPNMMWNLKYGMHSRMEISDNNLPMPIDEKKAIAIADRYLDKMNPGEIAQEAERYYGYYTIHTVTKDGEISGMLSVNGFTGQLWYHNWHGTFIDMQEY